MEKGMVGMNITSYHLIIGGIVDDTHVKKELVYRGNENIIIRCEIEDTEDNEPISILFPRSVLENFIKMINES
jgi:hypothetical protein